MSRESYFQHVGEFVHCFAQAEAVLHMVFHTFAKIDSYTAGIIKNEASASNLAKIIKALVVANDFDEKTIIEVNSLLDQFTVISEFRHRVLHRGALPHETEPDTFVSTNVLTARSFESYEIATFKLHDIEAAIADLRAIWIRMDAAANPATEPVIPEVRDLVFAPWRYKRAEPHTPYRHTKPERPSRRGQQQASPGSRRDRKYQEKKKK